MFIPLAMVRILSQEDVGNFKIFFLYVFMIPTFALTGGLVSGLGYWAGQGERGLQAIRLSNAIINISGLLVTLICLAVSPWIAAWFHWPVSYGVYFALSVFGAVCLTFLEESAIVTGRVWFGAIFLSGTEVLRSVVIVLTAWLSRDLGTVLFVCALSALTKVIASLWIGHRMKLVSFHLNYATWRLVGRDIWSYSFPVSMAVLLTMITGSGDQLLLSNILNPAEFAIYVVGCLTISPLLIIEQSITRVMIPRLSSSFAQKKFQHAAKYYRDAVKQLAWFLIPAVIGLIVFSRPIVELLFTKAYSASAAYLDWFALSYLFLMIPDNAVPRARGEGGWILRTVMMYSPLPIVLCLGLGLKYGAFGALAAMLISRAALKAYALSYIKKSTPWKYRDFLPLEHIALFSMISLVLALFCYALKPSLGGGLSWFFTGGIIYIVLYFPVSLLLTNLFIHRRPLTQGEVGNVLLFSQHLGIGGLERLVLSLAERLKKSKRWNVYVFSHDSRENAASYTEQTLVGDFLKAGIPVDAHHKGPGLSVFTLYRLLRNIFHNDIDVIHTHDMGTLVYAALANMLSFERVRIVHTQHSFVHITRFKRYALYERFFTRFVDILTVVNPNFIEVYRQIGVSRKTIHVVTNGVAFPEKPVQDFSEKVLRRARLVADLSEQERQEVEPLLKSAWILYLARLHSVKGQRAAAGLWRALPAELRSQTALMVVGPEAEEGELQQVLDAFGDLPDRNHVVLIRGTKKPQEWLASSDLFLSCSTIEGLPLGPIEALGAGLPAVLSRIDGHAFLQSVSLQYAPDSPGEGGALIEKALKTAGRGTTQYYASLWKQSEWIRQQYSLEGMVTSYERFYTEQLLGEA